MASGFFYIDIYLDGWIGDGLGRDQKAESWTFEETATNAL